MSSPVQPLMQLDVTPSQVTHAEALSGLATAAKVKRDRPFLYELITDRTREGHSLNRIVRDIRAFGHSIHERTIAAVLAHEFTPQQLREFRARAYAEAARVSVDIAAESLTEAAKEVEQLEPGATRTKLRIQLASTASVSAGIFNQNAELLAGNATHRVEEVRDGDPHADYQAALAKARAAAEALSGIRNVTPSAEVFTPETPGIPQSLTPSSHEATESKSA